MRLSGNIKHTPLHRFYRVLFWLLITVPILLVALSAWIQHNLENAQRFVREDAHANNFPIEVVIHEQNELQSEINTYTTIALVSLAAFVLGLLLPLLYRLLLYILHGEVAFRQRIKRPIPQPAPPHRSERHSDADHADARPDPFTVLGVDHDATFEEIKRAYRTKMQEYHPDKVASLGDELRELAERKAKQINEAFESLSRRYSAV